MGKVIKFLIILILILGVIIGINSLSFTISSKVNNKDLTHEYVFKDVFSDKDPLIKDIAIFGAHDAFSSGINFKSQPNINEPGIGTNKIVNLFAKGLMVRMAKSQNATCKELLYSGVRYLDIRITKIDDVYYAHHVLLSNPIDEYFQDIVDYLGSHAGEFLILDIQHFSTKDGKNYGLETEDYEALINKISDIKNSLGKSIFDYVFYNTNTDKISELTYTKVTNNRTSAGVVILMKNDEFNNIYYRDDDAEYDNHDYETIRSLWHETNNTQELLEGIEAEYKYITLHHDECDDLLKVNQAQKTGFLTNAKIIWSILSWSILDMANNFNREFISHEEDFMKYLDYMPIYMVDNATSTKGDFVKTVNEYLLAYNEQL